MTWRRHPVTVLALGLGVHLVLIWGMIMLNRQPAVVEKPAPRVIQVMEPEVELPEPEPEPPQEFELRQPDAPALEQPEPEPLPMPEPPPLEILPLELPDQPTLAFQLPAIQVPERVIRRTIETQPAPPRPSPPEPAPELPAPTRSLGFEQVDEQPRGRHLPPPDYPPALRDRGIEGQVQIKFLINTQGRVEHLQILDVQGSARFASAVRRVVQSWTFEPARHDGEVVDVWAIKTLHFRLQRSGS